METEVDWPARAVIGHHRHAVYFAEFARQNTNQFQLLRDNLENFKVAVQEVSELKMHKESLELARWLWSEGGRFLDLQGYTEFGKQILTHALNAARLLNDKTQEEQILGQLGRVWLELENVQTARNDFQEALALEIQRDHRRYAAHYAISQSQGDWPQERFQKAKEYFEQALALARLTNNQRGQASDLGSLGQIYLDRKNIQKAQEYFEQALALAREIANRSLEGRLLGSLGLVMSLKGDHQGALKNFEGAVVIAKEVGDWQGEASHLGGMGMAYKFLGLQNPPQIRISSAGEFLSEYVDSSEQNRYYINAIRCFKRALDIAQKMDDRKNIDRFSSNIAEVQALIDNSSGLAPELTRPTNRGR